MPQRDAVAATAPVSAMPDEIGPDTDRAAVDRALNTSAAVANIEAIRQSWLDRSGALRERRRLMPDLAYGNAPRARLDFYLADTGPAATVMFFHGGFWRRNSKEEFAFAAEGALGRGFNVAVVGYTLAPQAKIGDIVAQAHAAATWLHDNLSAMGQDPRRLYAAGWSAGAHLVSMIIDHPALRGGVAASGIYELDPIKRSSFNEAIRLDDDDVRRHSPIRHLPREAAPLVVAFGGDELPEFRRQSSAYFDAWRSQGLAGRLIELPACHHYATLEQFARPDSMLMDALDALT
jgi:acetyl esterase/lipase